MSESVIERKMLLGGDWVEGRSRDRRRADEGNQNSYAMEYSTDIRRRGLPLFLPYSEDDNVFVRKLENSIDVRRAPGYPKWLVCLFVMSLLMTAVGLLGLVFSPLFGGHNLVLVSLLLAAVGIFFMSTIVKEASKDA